MQPYYLPYADISLLPAYEQTSIEKAFTSISNDWQIEFNFPQGGCQQRAQLMSMLLQKKFNIEHCKIWLFAPAALYLNDFRMLHAKDDKTLSPGSIMEWSYHVAPAVRVQNGGNTETLIIDPSVNRQQALPLQQWFNAIGNSHTGKYCFLLPDKYFFNSSYHTDQYNNVTMLFDGTFFDYVNPAKDNLAVEKGLAINDMVMKIFHAHIAPLIERNNVQDAPVLEDLKAVFGNASVLDMVFSQNISGYTDNTTHRYLITHYNDIISGAKKIFNERLVYWTNIVNTLL